MNSGADRDASLLRRFDELAELAADERLRQLAALAERDPEIARDLRGMFGADSDPDGPLESGVDSLVEALVADEGKPLLAGQRIGPFVLERPLGRGGMGEVWLAAREEGGFRQTVALKRLKRGMDSDEILRRFVQERRILADLSHPNIARFIDGGVGADGVPWYAMEYVDGTPITAHADAHALDVRARVGLLALVAEAVAYAQNRLVVHRDLKPSNVLVDAAGVPHLLDFGIAKLLQGNDDPQATATGVRALSPAYAAPEQILDQAISAATDVYALGVVLYEMLTGELPHVRSGLSLEALVDGVRHETIERPSVRLRASATTAGDAARTQNPRRAVSGELDAIVLTALRREPERRYASASAMADDLRRWLDGRPVRAQPDTATYRIRKFVTRNRLAVGSASAVLLALIAGFGTALWQAREAQLQAQRAEREAAAARETATRTRRVKDFLASVFMQEDPVRRDARGPLTMTEAFEDALARIDTEFADDPGLQGDLLDDFGEIVNSRGDHVRAKALFERALANAERARGMDDPAVAEALVNLASAYDNLGEMERAAPLLRRSIGILERQVPVDAPALANAVNSLAVSKRNAGDNTGAIVDMRRALDLLGGPQANGQAVAMVLYNLATALSDAGRIDEADPLARAAVAAIERDQGPMAAPLAIALTMLEAVAEREGDIEELGRLSERRLAIAQHNFPGDHPWKTVALTDSGWHMVETGRAAEGEARIREAIAAFDRTGDDDIGALSARRRLAQTLVRRDDLAGAAQVLDEAIANCRKDETLESMMCLTIRANRAHLAVRLGDAAGALAEADVVAAAMVRGFGAGIDEHAQAVEARAAALGALGRREEARAAQAEALAFYGQLYGETHRSTVRARERLEAL